MCNGACLINYIKKNATQTNGQVKLQLYALLTLDGEEVRFTSRSLYPVAIIGRYG